MSLNLFTSPPVSPTAPPKPPKGINFLKLEKQAHMDIEAEVRRIVELPITKPLSEDQIDMVSRHYISPEHYNKGDRLRQEQALAMVHYNDYGGCFVTLGVGGGKTLISFMIANDCYKKIIAQRQTGDFSKEARILLVVQANLLSKFENDAKFMGKFLKEVPPYYIMKGSNKRQRIMMATSGRRGLYVCSYHTLSSKDATDTLEAIRPACIICDEAQNVAGNKESARAKRFRTYINQYQPEVIPLSGTMTRKSVMDYFFLAKASLGRYNFLPNSTKMSEEWAAALDSNAVGMGDFRNDSVPRPGPISLVSSWCHSHFPEVELSPNLVGFRRAYSKRMTTAPGVICSTTEDPVGAGLVFSNNPIKDKESRKGWNTLQDHLEALQEDFITPSGEQLTCAMNVWGYRYQMEATGFYYDLYWREPEKLAEVRKIPVHAAQDILERSRESHEAHRMYQQKLRWWLANKSKPHLDTPALVGTNMRNHGDKNVGSLLYNTWLNWKASSFEEMEVRQQRPVRVCDFKIKSVVEDVLRDGEKGAAVWYYHAEMGIWAMEVLRAAGLDPVHCPRGDWANGYLNNPKEYSKHLNVVAIGPHSEGKDLQFGMCRNYYLQTPISASKLEQNLGRTHRPGQEADEVFAQFYLSTEFDYAHFNSILNDTAYVQQTTQNKQKLLLGSYTFRPRSVGYTALVEMGAVTKKLDVDGERLLEGILEEDEKQIII